jgi:hypothetical protein
MKSGTVRYWWLKQVGFFRESLFYTAMLIALLAMIGFYVTGDSTAPVTAPPSEEQLRPDQAAELARQEARAAREQGRPAGASHQKYFPLIGLFFPLVATTYVFARVRVRQLEILDAFRETNLFHLYVKEKGESIDQAEIDFYKFLSQRVSERTSLFEYWLFSIACFLLVFLVSHFLLSTYGLSVSESLAGPNTPAGKNFQLYLGAAAGGFLGALSGSMLVVLRRYWTFDLQPTVFLQAIVVLVAVTLVCTLLSSLYTGEIMAVAALSIGFVSAINVEFLSRLMRRTFARITKVQLPAPIPSNLDEVVRNQEAIESLNAASIFSVGELANADPIRLYLAMPQQTSVINALIDQAILHYYFADKVEQLRLHGVVRFSQLLSVLDIRSRDGEVTLSDDVALLGGKEHEERELVRNAAAIVKSGVHHRVLSILLDGYDKPPYVSG